jgi:hypothetical protein
LRLAERDPLDAAVIAAPDLALARATAYFRLFIFVLNEIEAELPAASW